MRALVWEGPRRAVVREQAMPTPEAGEVLVRVACAGICGSELSAYLGHNALRVPPLVMGHEFSGQVVAFGDGARERNPALDKGTRVTVNPLLSCGQCIYCRRGDNHLCPSRRLIGAHRAGGYAEYVLVPADLALPLPEGMSLETGALTEPVAVGVRIGELAGDLDGAVTLVAGAGPIGLLALQALRQRGAARVFVSDLVPERLAMAESLGGEPLDPRSVDVAHTVREATDGLGAPVTVDAVGVAATRALVIAATRNSGVVILSGLHEETGSIPAADVIRREIVLHGSFAYSPANFRDALDRLARGEMRLDPWIAHADLAEGGAWFDRLIDAPGGVAKVLLAP